MEQGEAEGGEDAMWGDVFREVTIVTWLVE